MIVIYTQELNVVEIYKEAFVNITEQISNVKLEQISFVNVNDYNMTSVVIYSTGIYNSMTICYLESDLMYEIVLRMGIDDVLLKDEMDLYIKEYINIVCGRAISNVNSIIGRPSKFTVPDVYEGIYNTNDLSFYDNKEELFYQSKYGMLKVMVAYKTGSGEAGFLYAN